MNFKVWLQAARLRTLPLALSSIILGALISGNYGKFSWVILVLCILTATSYQVLSNFANDLGDGLRGTDQDREGEQRAVASGSISIPQMKKAVTLFFLISLFLGTALSYYATLSLPRIYFAGFAALGGIASIAAVSYTMGKNAYGYKGLGDLMVLIFFGWTGVMGSFFLQYQQFDWWVLLPSSAIGFVAMGVLNLNNYRDVDNDRKHGKNTLVVQFGKSWAKGYQVALLGLAILFTLLFIYERGNSNLVYLSLLPAILWVINTVKLFKAQHPTQVDKLLKPLAISAFVYALLLGLLLNL